jgi:hypothetical protein
MALEAQIKFMEPWLIHLEKESSQALQDFMAIFQEQFAVGKKALTNRIKTDAATRNHRITDITSLFDDTNKERKILAGKLTTRGAEKGLPENWPASFFRRAKRYVKQSPEQLRRSAIFAILAAHEVSFSDEQKQKLQKEKDLTVLDRWMSKAPLASKAEDLFAA